MRLCKSVNGCTKIYGIIGHPITHTLSPLIHNTLYEMLIQNNIYIPFDVSLSGLERALTGAYELNIQGINVTVPYKETVIPYLLDVEAYGKQIGAVNTLKKSKGGYIGYNTDGWGLLKSLSENDIQIKNKTVLIIGAGGAARSVAMMIAAQNPKKLFISNRTIKRGEDLANDVAYYYSIPLEICLLDSIDRIDKVDVCIQTTSVGMHPNKDQTPVHSDDFFYKIGSAVDLIYSPWETLFLKKARRAGCKTVNGFGMLFYQGIKAYEIWTEGNISKDRLDALFQMLKSNLNF